MPEAHGKLLWEVVSGELAGQAADQASLTGRAKDLVGVATISTTILSVLLNDKIFNSGKLDPPIWWIVLAGLALLVVFGAGLWAMQPAGYSFASDSVGFHNIEKAHSDAPEDALYRARAEGYLAVAADGRNQLDRNRDTLARIELLVRIETGGAAALGVMAFVLAVLVAMH